MAYESDAQAYFTRWTVRTKNNQRRKDSINVSPNPFEVP